MARELLTKYDKLPQPYGDREIPPLDDLPEDVEYEESEVEEDDR